MTQPPTPEPAPSPLATAEPWDLVSAAYTAEALPYFERFATEALRAAQLPRGARIVDVAAGPGTLSLLAAAGGARVSAIDFSEAMVAQFRSRAAAAGLADAVDVRVGDGQRLPFESAAYDAAFSMFGLMFFPDRLAGLREMRRVLRPGCPGVISSWVPFDGAFGVLLSALRDELPSLPLEGGRSPLSSAAEIHTEMVAAGFDAVRVETVDIPITAPSFAAFWDSMQRTNAPLVLVRHRLGARWSEVAPRIRDRVQAVVGDGPVVTGRGAFLGIGRQGGARLSRD